MLHTDPRTTGGHPGDNNRPPLAAAATSHPVTAPTRPAPANRCRVAVNSTPIAATASAIPRPGRTRRRHIHPRRDRQPGEEHPHRLRPRGEPPQPPAHRARRHPQQHRGLPVTQPQSRLARQRRADHRDRIRPPEQAKHRQQHMRRPTPHTPRPPRPHPLTTTRPPDRPDPGMTPRRQPTPTPRAPKLTRFQMRFHNRSPRRYRQHRCPRAPSHGPPATCLPGPNRRGRAVALPVALHTDDADHQNQIGRRPSPTIRTVNDGHLPPRPHPP